MASIECLFHYVSKGGRKAVKKWTHDSFSTGFAPLARNAFYFTVPYSSMWALCAVQYGILAWEKNNAVKHYSRGPI